MSEYLWYISSCWNNCGDNSSCGILVVGNMGDNSSGLKTWGYNTSCDPYFTLVRHYFIVI